MPNTINAIANGSTPWDSQLKSSHLNLLNHLVKETVALQVEQWNIRSWHKMFWHDMPGQASTNARIDFIKELAVRISQHNCGPNQPITLISLGSGGLLTEYYIHKYLVDEGYRDLHWRFIDVEYGKQDFMPCIGNFQVETNASHVRKFISEQDYFNEVEGGNELAKEDRRLGLTVVLSINGPNEIDLYQPDVLPPGQLLFRIKNVEDIERANSLFIFISNKSFSSKVDKNIKLIGEGNEIINCDNCLRCSINHLGAVEITFCPSALGLTLNKFFSSYLTDRQNSGQSPDLIGHSFKLKNLQHWVNERIEQLAKEEEDFYLATFYASDYDISLANLQNHCRDGQASLFADLNWNISTFH